MKLNLLLLSAICLFACNNNDAGNSAVHRPQRLLSVADLKFPLIDEGNGTPLLPKPNNSNLLNNHVLKRVVIQTPKDITAYADFVQERYKKETKNKKISFSEWYIKFGGLSDTNYYDSTGKLLRFRQTCIMPLHYSFDYDTMGFLAGENGGSCVIRYDTVLYLFDASNHILYQVRHSKYDKIYDLLCDLLHRVSITVYHFDSAGYLETITHSDQTGDYHSRYQFKYNAGKQITALYHKIWTKKDSEYDKATDPKKSIAPIANESITRYYYTSNSPDPIVTKHKFYKDPHYNYVRKTEFDSTGLPYRTVEIANGQQVSSRLFQYIKTK